jgi:hypothetical protein
MRKNGTKRLAVLAITLSVVAGWWFAVMYALNHWHTLTKAVVIATISAIAYVCIRLTDAALTDPQFSFRIFFGRGLISRGAIRVGVVLAVLLGISARNYSRMLMVVALVVAVFFNFLAGKKPRKDLAVIGVCLVAAAVFYLGATDVLPLGTIVGWTLFAIAILLYLIFPGKNHVDNQRT